MLLTDSYFDIKAMLTNEIRAAIDDLPTDKLKTISESYEGRIGLTYQTYSKLVDLVVDGQLAVVRSEYRPSHEDGLEPVFVDVDRHKKLESLEADKADWDMHWHEYRRMFDPYKMNGIRIVDGKSNADILFGDNVSNLCPGMDKPWMFAIKVRGEGMFGEGAMDKVFVFEPTCIDKQGWFAECFRPEILKAFASHCADAEIALEIRRKAEEAVKLGMTELLVADALKKKDSGETEK